MFPFRDIFQRENLLVFLQKNGMKLSVGRLRIYSPDPKGIFFKSGREAEGRGEGLGGENSQSSRRGEIKN